MPGKLDGRVALVTGGGRGIGRAIALGYAREGAHVIITAARNPDEAERTAADARDLPGRITAVAADVTSDADVARLTAEVPTPDALVSTGGATNTGMISPNARPAGVTLLEPQIVVPGAIHLALTRTSGQRIVGTEFQP